MSPVLSRQHALLLILVGAAACGGAEQDAKPSDADSSLAPPASAPASATAPVAAPVGPQGTEGAAAPAATARADTSAGGLALWDVASLEKRLDLQGMAPRKQPTPVRHPFLSVEGTAYLVGNAELQVFIYDSPEAVDRDVARLDTIAVAPRGMKKKWPTRVTFIRNSNLAAILLGQNGLQIERVQRALMAGRGPS